MGETLQKQIIDRLHKAVLAAGEDEVYDAIVALARYVDVLTIARNNEIELD